MIISKILIISILILKFKIFHPKYSESVSLNSGTKLQKIITFTTKLLGLISMLSEKTI